MASPSSPPTHALRPRRRCSARPPSPLPSLVLLSFPLPRPTPSAAEQQRIPLGVRVSFFSCIFLSGMRWLIMCCTLMGRRRAAFSRPFARPLASRLTDPTPAYTHRTLYSLPLHTQFARDHSRLHAHTHRPISSASFFQTRIPTSFPSKHLDFCPPGLIPSPDFIPHHRIGHRCSVCSRVPSLTTLPHHHFKVFR